jgi:3-deoxy-D-manno-octulosonate 8-phosphate phosphatase (KDO 8-P phosphatase)
MHYLTNKRLDSQLKAIKLLILDVDGIMTDGKIYYDHLGHEIKCFHAQDGLGIKCLQSTGIDIAVISGRDDACVQHRVNALGITHYYPGAHDKAAALEDLSIKLGLPYDAMGMMDDDWIDLPIFNRVGFSASVPNAQTLVRQTADYVTLAHGGEGAIRELCDLIMTAQQTLPSVLARYLK